MTSPNPKRLKMDEEAATSSSTMKKETPVADFDPFTSKFEEIVNKEVFVDKTLLIKTIFETDATGVLITAPRRFGKSTNMDMVKTYVEMQADANGIPIDPKTSTNYKVFKDNNLLIFQNENFFNEHFAAYPVIYANFACVHGNNFNDVLDTFRVMLHNTFKQHKYLLKSDKLSSRDVSRFNMYCGAMSYRDLTETDVEMGLKFLSEYLYKHFGDKKVFVLIDEYDAPINNTMFKENIEIMKYVNKLLDKIFSNALKRNNYVGRALLTGISYFASVALSGVNNIKKYMFLDNHQFVKYYGLTENETCDLLTKFKIDNVTKDKVKLHYNGYAGSNNSESITLYSLWSILHFLKERKIKDFWQVSGIITNLNEALNFPDVKYAIEKLSLKKSLVIEILHRIKLDDVVELRNLCLQRGGSERKQLEQRDLYLSFILQQGYLTLVNKVEGTNLYKVKAPNAEIIEEFETKLEKHYGPALNSYLKNCAALVNTIIPSSNDKVYEDFIKTFQTILKYREEKIIERNECTFHSLLFSVIYKTGFCIDDDNELAGSRYKPDLIIIRGNIGVIIEVKYKQDSKKALKQIIDKYYRKFDEDKFKQIKDKIFLGLNVSEDLIVSLSVLINSLEISEAKDYNI